MKLCKHLFIMLLLMFLVSVQAFSADTSMTKESQKDNQSISELLQMYQEELPILENNLTQLQVKLNKANSSLKIAKQELQNSEEQVKNLQTLLITAREETEMYKTRNKTILVFGGIAIGVSIALGLVQIFK